MLSALVVAIVRRSAMTASFSILSATGAFSTTAFRRRPTPPMPRILPSSLFSLGTSARSGQRFAGVVSMHSAPERHGRGVCASAQTRKARDTSPSSSSLSASSPSASSLSTSLPALTPDNFPGHVPVLLAEVLEAFSALENIALYVDGTLGAGGHASALVRSLGREKKLKAVVGLDVDPRARELARRALSEAAAEAFPAEASPAPSPPPPAIRVLDANFRDVEEALGSVSEELLASEGVFAPPPPPPVSSSSPSPSSSKRPSSKSGSTTVKASAILLDLGVSSMQLDSPERGFSFAADGPLDMRLDGGGGAGRGSKDLALSRDGRGTTPVTAATIVNTWPEADLASLFAAKEYGGERHAKLAARRIVKAREESEGTGEREGGEDFFLSLFEREQKRGRSTKKTDLEIQKSQQKQQKQAASRPRGSSRWQ
jgi:hypothetical protein